MTVNREKMYKHIGKRIYVARRIQGITPKIIEKRTGITREELYDIETGKREISVYELFCLPVVFIYRRTHFLHLCREYFM